jgi:hypothetical protein
VQALNCACAEPLLVADRYIGKRVQCPACRAVLVVPERTGDQPSVPTGIKMRQPVLVTEQPPPEHLSRWGEDAAKPLSPRPRWKVLSRNAMVLWMLAVPLSLGLGWLIAGYCFGTLTLSKIDAAKAQMRVIETAIDEYRLHHEVPPPSLAALLQPDPARGGSPYLKDIKAITDPWGNIFLYEFTDAMGPTIGFETPNGNIITNRDGEFPRR